MIQILKNLKSSGIYFQPNIPPKKITNLKNTLGISIDNSEILALNDDTVFGSAKAGIIFTESSFIHSEYGEFIYSEIKNIEYPHIFINKKGKKVTKKQIYIVKNDNTTYILDLGFITMDIESFAKHISVVVNKSNENLDDNSQEKIKNKETIDKTTLSYGLNESAINYADNVIFHSKQGHGYAAEKMNHTYDTYSGKDAQIIGDDNLKNGADRLVDGLEIQTKYYKNATKTIDSAFGKGQYKYLDSQTGKPMQLEVPSDQYENAIRKMEKKILEGRVNGITDPSNAKELVKKGEFTYQQAVNVAKFGTVEGLLYDASKGAIIASKVMGISTLITFATSIWKGSDYKLALKDATYAGLKTGGISFATSVATAQLGKTGLEQSLRGTTDLLIKSMGKDGYQLFANALGNSSRQLTGAAAANHASKLLRGNTVTAIATTAILSTADIYRLFNGKVSGKQVLKNITKTGSGVAGGMGGFAVGATAGATLGSVVPGVGNAIGYWVGGMIGSYLGGTSADKVSGAILDQVIDDDSIKMMETLEQNFLKIAQNYLLTEKEIENILTKLSKNNLENILREIYSSKNKQEYINNLLEPMVVLEIRKREKIITPNNEDILGEISNILVSQEEDMRGKRSDFLFVLYGLSLAIANIDGNISTEELNATESIFEEMIESSDFPVDYLMITSDYLTNPPSLSDITEYLHLLDNYQYEELKEMLITVMDADGIRDKNELEYIQDFEKIVTKLLYYKLEYDNNFSHAHMKITFKENIKACVGKCLEGSFKKEDIIMLQSDSRKFYTRIKKIVDIDSNEYEEIFENENRIIWLEEVPRYNIASFNEFIK